MSAQDNNGIIKDATQGHWVYKLPKAWQPFLQLSRLDRPIGYWLLALPGWIGLAFASLSHGLSVTDIKWAALILIGAITMRGAGCTYNDIVDQDLDKQVDRTALRPLPAGTITTKQAWVWLLTQCGVGLIVLLCLPRLAQIISLCSLPLVAAYPFMKRITWWPQVWLGMTFNWAVLVAYAAKTGAVHTPLFILYGGLIFWTIGYDTIYACQDIDDDAMVGIKSTARRFGARVKLGVGVCYGVCLILISFSMIINGSYAQYSCGSFIINRGLENLQLGPNLHGLFNLVLRIGAFQIFLFLFSAHLLIWQFLRFKHQDAKRSLKIFKSNGLAGILLAFSLYCLALPNGHTESDNGPCEAKELTDYYTPLCNDHRPNIFCSK